MGKRKNGHRPSFWQSAKEEIGGQLFGLFIGVVIVAVLVILYLRLS